MNLFRCANANRENVATPAHFSTPLGSIRLEARLDGKNAADEARPETYTLRAGNWVACWHSSEYDLELLACRPNFTLPPGMSVTDCWAGLWRLKAHYPIESCIFAAVWEAGSTWHDGGSDSGEGLYAKTWDDAKTEISIGTEGEEFLVKRARQSVGLPSEWASYFDTAFDDWRNNDFWNNSIHKELGDNGLAVVLPMLSAGQLCQIHFVMAWSAFEEQSVATWYAVDRNAAEILAGGSCEITAV